MFGFPKFAAEAARKQRFFVTSTEAKITAQNHLGAFTNYVDKILALFDPLPPSVDIFYLINVDKKWTFSDHLPPLFF